MLISFVIPVYNRPSEIYELLESMVKQQHKEDFEVIIVEDGSDVKCINVVEEYITQLNVKYIEKSNSGPGLSRNYGSEKSQGEYIVYLDSDVILPDDYVSILAEKLQDRSVEAFGGPDAAASDFTDMQKAVTYAMTSFFTTGGIRGSKSSVEKFVPRGFNMGYRRDIYEKTGGFSKMRFGEDMELSYRIKDSGYKSILIPEIFVYHKRRTSSKSFFKQVFFSGMTRVNLYLRFPKTLKLVHLLPSLFLITSIVLLLSTIFINRNLILPLILLMAIWLVDSTLKYSSLNIGIISIKTSLIQLYGYGLGFLFGVWKRLILKNDENSTFQIGFIKKYF